MYVKLLLGLELWFLNRRFNKLAISKSLLEEFVHHGIWVIELKSLTSGQGLSNEMKKEFVKRINSSEGFDTLKIRLFKECLVIYKEQAEDMKILRSIEVHLTDS